jgi:acyl-coenzyme A synthetase/AMP-(fatty) acid ligase
VPQLKPWKALRAAADNARLRFGQHLHITATVPSQHLYGLETTVMMALAAGCTIDARQPFFPLDVQASLAALPPPRVLVTTPVHLRALLAAGVTLPPLAWIISATAPLPPALAAQAEAQFGAPLGEIYGCTEAGSMATRRTTQESHWTLFPGLHLDITAGQAWLHSGYLDPVPLSDALEPLDARRFRLLGRATDLVKVAGKRLDLTALTEALLAIPGVQDATVLPPDDEAVTARPAALVVAPSLSESQILAALAACLDPVFLPRPLKKVASLPRNAVGKLPRVAVQELLRG